MSAPTLPPWYAPDLPGQDLRPDPDTITTVAELLEAMRLYRIWAGNISYRKLSAVCRNRFSPSGFHKALNGGTLPGFELVRDFIGACGATEDYRDRFLAAWRRVAIDVARAAELLETMRPDRP